MINKIKSHFTTECPWRDTLYWYDSLDSTNTQAKRMAQDGAPHGTVVIAGSQTGGRGRMGRSFLSPAGGVYLSVILRPACTPDKLMHLTCAAAAAGCEAVENASGLSPEIKWTNDLVIYKKKLGGILTELALDGRGFVDYAIIGIGINCCQKPEDFPPELQSIATSVSEITNAPCSPARLAAAITEALYKMDTVLLSDKQGLMDSYRRRCMTIGKDVVVLRGGERTYGTALGLDENGGLVIRFFDGVVKTVTSGEVSVRGMYGYV